MTTTTRALPHLAEIALPDFGMPDDRAAAPRRPLRRAAGAAAVGDGREGLRPPRRVGRPGAQRQPRLPQRLRPPLRGGAAGGRPDGRPGRARGQRVRGHGRRGAPAHARRHVPGLQPPGPAPRRLGSAALDPARRGHPQRRARRDRGLEGLRFARDDRAAVLPGRRAASRGGGERAGGERDGPPDRPRHRAAGGQRAGPARRVRVGRVPDLVRRAARAHRSGPGHDRARVRAAAGVERHPALVPSHAHRRTASAAGVAEPGRPAHRARRSLHDRLRDLGRAVLPGRLRGGGRGRARGGHAGLRRATRGAVLRGGRGVVRRAARRAVGWGAAAHRRPPPRATRSSASA